MQHAIFGGSKMTGFWEFPTSAYSLYYLHPSQQLNNINLAGYSYFSPASIFICIH